MKKILCIGELLIDFFTTEIQQSLIEATTFEKQAGGAPANVAAAIAKFGGNAFFCGKVGDDAFGHFLQQTLQNAGVCTEQLILDPSAPTTLAFVSREMDGERDFIFNRGADELLRIEDLYLQKLMDMDIIHFGSATALLSDPFSKTYEQLMQTLIMQNHFISFDPNYRTNLWKGDTERFIEKCAPFIDAAHFIKMSSEELLLFARTENFKEALNWATQFEDKAIAITQGAEGTIYIQNGVITVVPSISVNAIDATGAGDAFVGAVLYELALRDTTEISQAEWVSIIEFANRVGAKVCEKVGAIEALPTLTEAKMA
ncbi:carbohydrate kinase family protein [Solibacillus daqui]|uniref:carbohydrate kinase family protein n=1 Tax=Solibacillus daqui TaxID=2912187 RepID=UPI002365F2F9|nr:carbohydrate kinase [Solibacillus daqui]